LGLALAATADARQSTALVLAGTAQAIPTFSKDRLRLAQS
jgi:hypothetical protein